MGKKLSIEDVDNQLKRWRQGDFSRDCQRFVFVETSDPYGVSCYDAEHGIQGMVVLTQTCDIVRSATERPFIEVCPLVALTEEKYALAAKGKSPRYAVVPGTQDNRLVADLDRVMTVHKCVVAGWNREQGCNSDDDRIRFAQALERKRGRFAFPNDFSEGIAKLRGHIFDKYRKLGSPAGEAYRNLEEIRVRAAPNWESDEVELTFYFIISLSTNRSTIAPHIEDILKKIALPGKYKFSCPPYYIATLDDLTARDYQESVSLNFEILSLG